MCEIAVEKDPSCLSDASDHFKTKEMCDKEVRRGPWLLKYVPDWFIRKQQIKSCYYHCGDEDVMNGYQKRKAQKA